MSYKNGVLVDKGKYVGSVTIFAAMSFMLVVSVVVVLIEGARQQGARAMVAMSADMALDGMFSGFERELLDKYEVLLFDGADGGDSLDEKYISETIEEKIKNCLDMDAGLVLTEGTDFYDIGIDEVKVTGVLTAADAFGLIWRKDVNDYAKIDYTAKFLESLLGLENVEKESKEVKAASKVIDDCMEQVSDFYNKYLSLIEHVDGVETGSNGVNFDKLKCRDEYVKRLGPGGSVDVNQENISINDYRIYEKVKGSIFDVYAFRDTFLGKFSDVIDRKSDDIEELVGLGNVIRKFLKNMQQEVEKSLNIIDDIRGQQTLISEKISAAEQYISSISHISQDSLEGLRDNLKSVEDERDKILKKLGDVDAMYEALKNNLEVINQAHAYCKNISFMSEYKMDISKAVDTYNSYKKAFEQLQWYRTDSMWLDYNDVACRDEDKSILGCIYDYTADGMLGLILPSGTKISEKSIGNMKLADLYGERGDRAQYIEDAAADFMNEALFNIYIMESFDNYIDNDGEGYLDYEQEYIMFGKSSDKENLKAAVIEVSAMRLGCNMIYILTDAAKKSEAYNVAMAALGFTGIVPLVKALQYVILTAWAVGETVVDMRQLMSGKKVPILKKKGEWKLELDDLIAGKLDAVSDDGGDDGFDYGQYLAALILSKNAQDKAFRSMAVVEMYMILQGVDNFRLKNYIYGLDISVLYHVGEGKTKYTYKCSYTY